MGFNKRTVKLDLTINSLKNNNLNDYYGKSDMLIFEDDISSMVFELYNSGLTESEILIIINKNMEETNQ
jgi:hypothetical protein